jgi:UDP-N-acetylmuramoyl-tripeptide--D-alanyl-D-alanine ligase
MLELGPKAPEFHREIGRLAAGLGLDFLALTGDFAAETLAGAQEAGGGKISAAAHGGPEAAARWAREILGGGGVALVKGSRAGGLERAAQELLKG